SLAPLMQLVDAGVELNRDEKIHVPSISIQEVIDLCGATIRDSYHPVLTIQRALDTAAASSLAVDLLNVDVRLNLSGVTSPEIAAILEQTHRGAKGAGIILQGLEPLAGAAALENMKLTEWLGSLRAFGVRGLEDSQFEGHEKPLGLTEKLHVLCCAVDADLRASVQLSLDAINSIPDWSGFCEDLVEIRAAITTSNRIMDVHLATHSATGVIMPSEYMKALVLTRLTLGTSAHILTQPTLMPSLAPDQGIGAAPSHHPVMKLVSVVGSLGANGLGPVSLGSFKTQHLAEDLKASGQGVQLLNILQQGVEISSDKAYYLETLRHVPDIAASVSSV
ncbi:MAG: hypothetical protein NTV34_04510, partial [Proteobacteria bacterium]|nr:hypothetical protein [Pseudomonadota bacterium]